MLVGLTALSVEIITNSCTPCSSANLGQLHRAQHVVLDGLARVVLHHRHVLVGGGMEHDVRPVQGEDLVQSRFVRNVGDEGMNGHFAAQGAKFLLDQEQAVFGPLDHHQRLGPELEHLPADFRADAAAGAGHQNGAPGDERADRVAVELRPARAAASR